MLDVGLSLRTFAMDAATGVHRCSWAHYERATREEIQLMPPEYSIRALADDYRHMQNMIFGDKPSFAEILDCIGKLEAEIHAL